MYKQVGPVAPLTQGDIIDGCPLLVWEDVASGAELRAGEFIGRVVVLTQACDLNLHRLPGQIDVTPLSNSPPLTPARD